MQIIKYDTYTQLRISIIPMPDTLDTLHYLRLKKTHNVSQTGSAGGTYLERVGLCHSH